MINFSKLADGNWALRSSKELNIGSKVEVLLKSGGTKVALVGDFISWVGESALYKIAAEAPKPSVAVGDLSGIIALFDKAKQHLQSPQITVGECRLSIAGPKAKVPGSITVVSAQKLADGSRSWFGRVLKDGTYQPTKEAPEIVATQLKAFALNPAEVAAHYGKLNSKCVFCGLGLGPKDKTKKPSANALKSLAVGYGKDCAEHFGLPWGEVSVTGYRH